MRARLTASLLVLVVAATACGGARSRTDSAGAAGDEATGASDEVFRTAYQADIETFDPDNGFEVAGLGAINAVYEGLVEYTPGTTDVVGLLAERFEVADDGLTYTFTLRDGVTFHDGTPMTSATVVESLERRRTGELLTSYFLANVEAVDAPDERTVVLHLAQPQPSLLDNLASPWGPKVISPAALEEQAANDAYLTEHGVGTGPLQLTEFRRGQRYVLDRFDDYWGEPAQVERVEIEVIPDVGQQTLRLQRGEIDAVLHGYPFDQLDDLPDGLAVTSYKDLGLEMAYVNTTTLPDASVREAIATAVAPQGWVADAFGDYAEPAASLYPIAMLRPDEPFAYPDDLDAARRVVDAAGDVTVDIVYTQQEEAVQRRVADLLIARLGTVGVQATARAVPNEEVFGYPEDPAGAPDIVLAQNNPDSAHPEAQASVFFTSEAPLNLFAHANAEADALFAEAGTITDVAERDARYVEAARLLFEEFAFLPLADVDDVIVHREGLTDLGVRPAIPWNVDLGTVSG